MSCTPAPIFPVCACGRSRLPQCWSAFSFDRTECALAFLRGRIFGRKTGSHPGSSPIRGQSKEPLRCHARVGGHPVTPGAGDRGEVSACYPGSRNRDRGEPRGSAPPTPPYVRVRIRRFGRLDSRFGFQGCETERGGEEGFGQSNVERGARAEPPGAMGAAGSVGGQLPTDAEASQPFVACASALPLLPGDGAQPSPDPVVEVAQHRRSFAEAKVGAPSDEIARQLLGDLREALAARAPRELPDLCLEAGDGLRRDPAPRLLPARKAKAQELAC